MLLDKNKLALKVLIAFFIATFVLLSYIFDSYTEDYAITEAEKSARSYLLTHKAIHKFINTVSRPEIYRLKSEGLLYKDYFSPRTMSFTYTARRIKEFHNIERKKEGLTEVYFKLATNNPRNEINRADKKEAQLLAQMNKDEIKNYKEILIDENGNKHLYLALSTKANTKGCLKCHGILQDAPKEMIAQYPLNTGYDEEVGNIRALISIKIPLTKFIQEAKKNSNIFIIIILISFILLYSLILFFIKRINKQELTILDKSKALEHMAKHDSLTGLANVWYFKEYANTLLSEAIKENKSLAFIYIDLGGFKQINDEISHQAGDMILKELSDRFTHIIDKNSLIARIGGNTFCLLVSDVESKKQLNQIAKYISIDCSKPVVVGGMELHVDIFVGISSYPEDGSNYDELLSYADNEMYLGKKKSD